MKMVKRARMRFCFASEGKVTERFEGRAFRTVKSVGGQGIVTTALTGFAAILARSQPSCHMVLQEIPFHPAKRQSGQIGARFAFMELN